MNSHVTKALISQDSFSREQVAWLMSQAMRWGHELGASDDYSGGYFAGYQACLDEWNAAAAAVVADFNARDVADGLSKKWLRDQADAMARTPRINDHRGGPAERWGDEGDAVHLRVAA